MVCESRLWFYLNIDNHLLNESSTKILFLVTSWKHKLKLYSTDYGSNCQKCQICHSLKIKEYLLDIFQWLLKDILS